jgi:galactokinase
LRVTPVKMPTDAVIVVADSLEIADKSGKVREEYNRRVVECGIAAQILGKVHQMRDVRVLGDIVKTNLWQSRDLIETLATKVPDAISIARASKLLDIEEGWLLSPLLGSASQIKIDESRPLEILRRTRHVLTETERVNLAAEALAAGRLEEMGVLMNTSHQSLRDDFDASTERLDAMVACAREAGALGARLTGAGFGGCIIALAREDGAAEILNHLEKHYYAKLGADAASRALHTIVRAGPGASVIELS